jgi:nucleotide-binding universal stress UspA family protein
MEKERSFVVPYDFTTASEKALDQAVELSKIEGSKIIILHVINKDAEREEADNKLKHIISNFSTLKTLEYKVEKGSIFTTIGEVAEKSNSSAVIMGTHGVKGMQKVFGSFAMKVIISTGVPFMVVQKETEIKEFNNICLSIDATAESIQIIKIAGDLAKTYNAKIHIIAEKEKDVSKARKIKNNLHILSKKMKKIEVNYELELLENKGEWIDTVINFAHQRKMDMFAYSYDSDRLLASKDKFSQSLLFNSFNIPALIINAKKISSTYF